MRAVTSASSLPLQRVAFTPWHPRLHTDYFPELKRMAVVLRLGSAHLMALGGRAVGKSLPWCLWGGDVLPYVGPLWEFAEEEEPEEEEGGKTVVSTGV